jgi:hypothetical protein
MIAVKRPRNNETEIGKRGVYGERRGDIATLAGTSRLVIGAPDATDHDAGFNVSMTRSVPLRSQDNVTFSPTLNLSAFMVFGII